VLIRRGGRTVAADVIDFKSDALVGDPETARARLAEQYAGQLDCYARAVSQIHELPRRAIVTRLVLLATQQVIVVPPGAAGTSVPQL
jgi:ATP-dependent exoDNAse (exonuclease V) beta subunit